MLVEITRNLRKKLSDARKKRDDIVIVNMKNEKYKSEIIRWAKTLGEENNKSAASLKAVEMGQSLLGQFEGSGARHFFRNAGDEGKIRSAEALEK